MKRNIGSSIAIAVVGWAVALAMFFPIFWMVLTGFKSEVAAVATPPQLFFKPTLASTAEDQQRADYLSLATPAAYSMAFFPTKKTRSLLLWMLSTKMLPAVGVLVPIYLLCRDAGLLDSRIALIIVYTLMNLPIVVWLLFTFFKDVPHEILEAGRMDGARLRTEIWYLLMPLALPGIASTALLSIILCWNEAFWSLNLTSSHAAPLTAFIASFSSPEGLFFAKLSAASTIAIAPILIFGWLSQRQLVQGLTFGAVK
jgi:sorbitol/mannitol transport system permease protein